MSKVVKTNKQDGNAIKRALDDSLIKFITEDQALREDATLATWVLVISFVSVVLALTAQFYPAPFPQNWHVLAICCPSYFVLSGILQFIQTFVEKDFILLTYPEHVSIFYKFS